MADYLPSTAQQRRDMLADIGVKDIDELYRDAPASVRCGELNLPNGIAEQALRRRVGAIAAKNTVFRSIFRGAGAYDHYIPAVVDAVAAKDQFVTAYTPYQAEISQGILQSIFEYQTGICELTGMDVANASVYDGASAAAEAVAMCTDRKRRRALVSAAVQPDVLETVRTYCLGSDTELVVVPQRGGVSNTEQMSALLDESTACVLVQSPNRNGLFEDCEQIASLAHAKGARLVMSCHPLALAVAKTPRECGADVAVGEGQPLGLPLSFGGPYLGYMASTKELMRRLPGRVVGETLDTKGERAFVLTLQAREQHIRREKAGSNICSNEALCALRAGAYLAAMGPDGVRDAAVQCMSKARYLAKELCSVPGIEMVYPGEYFCEFVTRVPVAAEKIEAALAEKGILGGLPVDGGILWCATEKCTKDDMDELVSLLRKECGR